MRSTKARRLAKPDHLKVPQNVAIAKKYGLELVCYEGGQNLATENDGNGKNDSAQ